MSTRMHFPPIRPDQLTMGYAAELAARFRCSSVNEFCADFEIDFRKLARGDGKELDAFAKLTGIPVEHLRRYSTIHQADGAVRLGEAVLTEHVLSRSRIRVCPQCVRDDLAIDPNLSPDIAVYWRRKWAITCVDTCDVHYRPLVEVAHIKGSQFQWDATLAWSDLSLNLGALLECPIRRRPHRLQEYAIGRMDGGGISVGLLDHMHLHQAISACAKFGSVSMNIDQHWRHLDEPTRHRAYREGFDVLAAGAQGVSSLLNRRLDFVQAAKPRTLIGPSTLLKQVYLFLGKTADDPMFDQLREVVAEAVFDVLPIGPEDEPVLGHLCKRRRTYSMMAACRRFGMAHRTFALYAEAAGVAIRTPQGSLRIDAPLADAFFGQSGGIINLSSAGKDIGASRPTLDAFIEAGLLTPLSTAERRERRHLPVRRKDVEALLNRFIDKAESIERPPYGAVALTDLWRHVRGSYVQVHELILDGKIWVGRVLGGKSYAALFINLAEVRASLERVSALPQICSSDGSPQILAPTEAAAIACINLDTLRKLASDSAVRSVAITNPESGQSRRMFHASDMKAFAAKYISLTRAARQLKVQPRRLRQLLDDRNIPTAFSQNYGANLYRREDILAANLAD